MKQKPVSVYVNYIHIIQAYVFKLEFTFIETLDSESYAIDIINVIKMETVRLDDTFVIMF